METYADFQRYMAKHGFSGSVLSEAEFKTCHRDGLTESQIYGVACDVSAGLSFGLALIVNHPKD